MKRTSIIVLDLAENLFTYNLYKALTFRKIDVKFAYISDMYEGSNISDTADVFLIKHPVSEMKSDVTFAEYDILIIIDHSKNISSDNSLIIPLITACKQTIYLDSSEDSVLTACDALVELK